MFSECNVLLPPTPRVSVWSEGIISQEERGGMFQHSALSMNKKMIRIETVFIFYCFRETKDVQMIW